jgi:hypothetical protein
MKLRVLDISENEAVEKESIEKILEFIFRKSQAILSLEKICLRKTMKEPSLYG